MDKDGCHFCGPMLPTTEGLGKDTMEIVLRVATELVSIPPILGIALQSRRELDKSFEKLGLDMMRRSMSEVLGSLCYL